MLGIIQGLTEFLPVSSTGHLVVTQSLLGLQETDQLISLDIFLHLATITAVLVFFRHDVYTVIRNVFNRNDLPARDRSRHLIVMIILAIVSTTVVYFIFKKEFEDAFQNPHLAGGAFLVTAAFLAAVSLRRRGAMSEADLTWWHALLIGVAQGIAITPGISRSGITICAALVIGLGARPAFRFSFLLSIPTIILAWLYDIVTKPGSLASMVGQPGPLAIAFVAAFIMALLAIALLKNVVLHNKLWVFSIYLIPAGILVLHYIAFYSRGTGTV